MGSCSTSWEESRFFDAKDQMGRQGLDLASDCTWSKDWEYDVWIGAPQSVRERRRKFMRWMELNVDEVKREKSIANCDDDDDGRDDVFNGDIIDRIMDDSGAVLRTSGVEDDEFSSSRSSVSSWNLDDLDLNVGGNVDVNVCSTSGSKVDRVVDHARLGKIRIMGSKSNQFESISSQLSPSTRREIENTCYTPRTAQKLKERVLRRLRSMSCILSSSSSSSSSSTINDIVESNSHETRIQSVKVRHSQRKSKELSALFTAQDIQAHQGSILTMKFSPDGQYMASAGEDMIVRVWQVVEDERSDTIDIPDADPSCVYFSVNRLSELEPLMVEKDKSKTEKLINLRRMPHSSCVIFPPKVFRIVEKPLHEFKGHNGEVLDLSWSKNNCLLSSSVDKTVRLWRVGVDQCLKVFLHSDYVTCIQFNPVNDDYFISGSIDGKVRIWAISGCHVVDWSETKDIITAVSYRLDGQGGLIGCITGTCHFFSLSDNHFQLDAQMCLASKKKSACKRITGFQFLPQDPNKVLVTCADSQVRIMDGVNVVGKYKGLRNTGNQISASFTADGKHIVSVAEDSHVYMWNYIDQGESSFSQPKANKSFEFFSCDASVALPWPGLKKGNSENDSTSCKLHDNSVCSLPFSTSTCFSLSQEFLDSSSKGSASATWPEEKLPVSSPRAITSLMGRAQYKLLKTSCQSSSNSHAWGLVIVTAGWDGRIRTFHNYGLPIPL